MPITKFDGAEFRRLRESLGLSREEAATRAGIGYMMVVRYELGTATPKLQKVGELAAVVGVSANDLIVTEFHAVVEQVTR